MAPRWKTIAIVGWSFGFGCLAMIGVNAAQERMEIRGNIKLFGELLHDLLDQRRE